MQMSRLIPIAWRRRPAPPPRRRDASGQRPASDDFLTCLLAFSAAGLFASCLALAMQHEIPHIALLELILICAAPPLAALAGLLTIRRRS
jgi:hypothetical protein